MKLIVCLEIPTNPFFGTALITINSGSSVQERNYGEACIQKFEENQHSSCQNALTGF